MTTDYEAEQERLKLEIEATEEWLETQKTMNADIDAFVALNQKYVDVPELTPTIVNEYIKKSEVFAPDKSSGKRAQKVKIYFDFVDDVMIPMISETLVAKSTLGRRKTARPLQSHRSLSLAKLNNTLSLSSLRLQGLSSAPEKIRTPDTTVRSRMLYPAELLTHCCSSTAKAIIAEIRANVNHFFEFYKITFYKINIRAAISSSIERAR